MDSVQTGMWDPPPPSKHATPLPQPHPPNLRLIHVSTATPAKRITFYKSGDSQFGGVRMAVHKRSFKCFDALLDDLSQKVPLPFGVRTVTTPRGTHSIKHLEQLQDGGCYLCSDRRQAKPVNMELARKRPSIWCYDSRRPQRPEASPTTPAGHLPYRQRRILLVKNSEPGMRRSVVLSRRSTRSLRAFLDEVSEVMQFHVRKLYTAEGRRIDSVQSLITCPGVLVCVGREAFSPTLVNFIRKSSDEKLPGLGSRSPGLGPRTPGNGARSPATQGGRSPPHGAQSRASEYSEGQESKKNVNFGLETKKSIIHPRSDSSNRSTRFSLSSEKSYSNGVSAYSKPAIMNEDIEKRVLVNKDGSLSVEMRVRFRLQNDETLQWSTQIKKSPSLTNECCPLSQAQPHYLQQSQSESCSDPDSTSFEPEGVDYSSQHLQGGSEGNHCPRCHQRQEQQYDLWENPAHSHKQPPVPPPHTSSHTHTIMRHTHSSSSSSSCNSRRVVRCGARLSSCRGGSGLEHSQLVQEEMCVTEQVERTVEVEQDGNTHVKVCSMSRCRSRSEVVAMESNLPLNRKSIEDEPREGEGDRPLSAVSSSSHVLQSLKEDEDDDMPPSASQCCRSNEPSPSPTFQTHLSDKPTSDVSAVSQKDDDRVDGGSRAASVAHSCHCGAATARSEAEAEETDQSHSALAKKGRASCGSNGTEIPNSEEEGAADDEDEEIKRVVRGVSAYRGPSAGSLQSRASSVCLVCCGCKRGANSDSNSRTSQRSHHSHQASPNPATPLSNRDHCSKCSDDDGSDVSAVSTQSNKTNLTNHGCSSAISNVLENRESSAISRTSSPKAPSATSATSHRSSRSHKYGCNGSTGVTAEKEEERSPSAVSAQSKLSAKSSKSYKSHCSCTAEAPDFRTREEAEEDAAVERAPSSLSAKSGASSNTRASVKLGVNVASLTDNTAVEKDETHKPSKAERPDSILSAKSAKSNLSAKSGKSHRSTCSHCARAVSPGAKAADEPVTEATGQDEGMEAEERAASAMSDKSNLSAKSNKSHKSTKASGRSLSPRSETGGDGEKRAASQMSGKSNTSVKSSKSCKSNDNGNETEASLSLRVAEENEMVEENRTPSAMSGKSHTSAKSSKSHRSNCTAASPNPHEADGPSVETNGDGKQNQERVASAMSVKSKSSKSHKSVSPSPNIVTIRTPEGTEKEANETERAPSASSALSHKSNPNRATDADEEVVEDNAPRNKSSEPSDSQTLSPKMSGLSVGEARGPSALSVHSTASAKSGRSKCRCGAASTHEKAMKEKRGAGEEENKKDNEEPNSEEASERAASILSSSTKRQRRESGGTEQPLSRNSSGSVSLGLPEDQDTGDSDSGKSSVSFHINTESKSRVKTATPDSPRSTEQSVMKEDVEGTNLCHNPSAVNVPTIETPGGTEDKHEDGGEQKTVRATSAFSAKSSMSHKSSCNCSVKAAPQTLDVKPKEKHAGARSTNAKQPNDLETGSVEFASTSNVEAQENRALSAMSSASAKVRSKSPASASVKNIVIKTTAGDSENNANESQRVSRPASKAKGEGDTRDNKAASVHSKSPCCLRPESAASAQSGSMKASKDNKGEDPVKCHKAKSSGNKTSSSQNKETTIKSLSPSPSHSSRPGSKVESCGESILSHSLSAADLLRETREAARPHSRQSKASKTSDKPRSEKSGRCQRNRNQMDQEEVLDLIPACLPNASPNEVVSDWLRSIPTNSMLAPDGLNEEEEEQGNPVEERPGEEVIEEEGSPEDEKAEAEEKEEEKSSDVAPGAALTSSRTNTVLLSGDSLARNWNSSAAVMKVLLNSSLGRCQSLPEVSPVYGRRLSTSARGLLDCLVQLQLIEPAVSLGCDQQKTQHYEDITAILQSLWLTEPRNTEAKETKDAGDEQVTPPRSSSGVDMSSGSGGSGKENRIQGGDETKQNNTNDAESLHEDEGVEKVVEEEGNAEGGHKEIQAELEETAAEQAKANIAEEAVQSEEQSTVPPKLDSPKAAGTPSSSDKSSANSSSKSPTDNERETLEDSSSGTPPTVLRAPLSKRLSQDPDPVWILHLLKKLEKQFMNHYINAMAEFKVRWDLDDSLILDTMMSELREEVSRRIQSSIEREIRKIQSRAGRVGRPRPPQGGNLSRDSSMTEKRRRMLKIMKNQSVKTADSLSDGEMTGEFSDQRSDDEYCPCDACVRKKMAARPLTTNPMAAEAPVMMEFDLLKILQLKKSPSPAPAAVTQPAEGKSDSVVLDEEGRNLEVVQEEDEEEEEDKTKDDVKANVVLEETIQEEDEEVGEEEDCGEAGEEEEVEAKEEEKEENSVDDEHEEGETGDEKAGEEGTSENGEEEEEEEAECHCQSARNEEGFEKDGEEGDESDDNTGEDETKDEERAGEGEGERAEEEGVTGGNEGDTESGEEEEESDKEREKEATAVEGETTDNGEGEEETKEEEVEVEECEVSDLKPEKEEEEDNAEVEEVNEESTLAEELVEGNVSASAEGENVGTSEGESHEDEKRGESEAQGGEASEEEISSPQGQGVTNGGALLHQFTRTSVESQPGSLEDIDTGSPQNPVNSIEVPKMAAGASSGGGAGQRRSRSPARVKRRKPKESDVDLDDC